jgi:hypothetical protein
MPDKQWIDVGSVEDLKYQSLQEVSLGKTTVALTYKDGSFAAISGVCNHVGGPLGEGTLDGDYAAFIIMGGQDNVQGVAGQLMTFFSEVGCQFPQFPFIAHSRGWSAEDMERNVSEVQNSLALREGAQQLVTRAADMANLMVGGQVPEHVLARGGRKAHQLDSEPTG